MFPHGAKVSTRRLFFVGRHLPFRPRSGIFFPEESEQRMLDSIPSQSKK